MPCYNQRVTRRASSPSWVAVLLAAACGSDPAPAVVECREDRDCSPLERCIDLQCIDVEGVDLDAGVGRDGPPLVLLDAGEGRSDAAVDAGRHADAASPDAAAVMDATAMDSGAADTGPWDAGREDTGPQDGGTLDAATPPDSGPPDSGVADSGAADSGAPRDAGPVARGIYSFRRLLPAGIPSNQELGNLAVSPDDRTLIASARYDVLHALDIATETATASVTLPKDSNEDLLIDGLAYSADGSALYIAATALIGAQNTPEGRLYRAGPRLEGLAEIGTRRPGRYFTDLYFDRVTGDLYAIAHQPSGGAYIVAIDRWTEASSSHSTVAVDVVGAGCQGIGIAADGLGGRGLVFTCGVNGAVVGIYDSTGVFNYGGNAGNTSKLASRPQEDYALAVSWSGGRLARFEQGVWTLGFSAPSFGTSSVWNIAFSDDGARALITGQYTGGVAVLREYRHNLYSTADLTDVSIPNFGLAPWLGASGVLLDDAVFRPGSDCGFIAGGCSSFTCTRGYLVAFEISNGRPCP